MGLGGQYAFTKKQEKRKLDLMKGPEPEVPKGPGLIDRMFNSKWNPVKKLTNEEYSVMLEERLLRVDADIAIAEEELQKLRKEAALKEVVIKK